jgi:hypothetical protein
LPSLDARLFLYQCRFPNSEKRGRGGDFSCGDLRIRVIYAPDEAMMQCPTEIKTYWGCKQSERGKDIYVGEGKNII